MNPRIKAIYRLMLIHTEKDFTYIDVFHKSNKQENIQKAKFLAETLKKENQ